MKEFGVLVPIVTPCFKDGTIDFKGLKNVAKDMLEAGCNGIFVAGSTGRGPWFSLEERKKICSSVRECIGDKMPIYAGCMATGLTDMINNAEAMAKAGADIAVITAPGYFSYNITEVGNIFLDFANKSPLPVLIYDIPDFSGIKLNMDIVLSLAKHPNVVGLKDSSSDMERFKELTKALGNNEDIYLFQGKEHLLAESIMLGASGIVVSLLHIDPRPFVDLYKAAKAGDRETAMRIQKEIVKVLDIVVACFKKRPEISTLFHILNNALKTRGVCDNIILKHEGECPKWLIERSNELLKILGEV